MRWGMVFLMMWIIGATHASDQILVEMRDVGYTLGDEIDARVTIRHADGESLDPKSLPAAGRVTSWLELKKVDVRSTETATTLSLKWQVFATVEQATVLHIPPLELRMRGQRTRTVKVPATAFHLSPVLTDPLEDRAPRKNLPPQVFDERTPLWQGIAGVLLAVLSGMAWLWMTDRMPGLPRRPGPFTRLERSMRRLDTLDNQALQRIHASMCQAAGMTLYPNTLHRLFERATHLELVRTEIENFYRTSWRCIYADHCNRPDYAQTLEWIRRAARIERMHAA